MIIMELEWRDPLEAFRLFIDEPYATLFYSKGGDGGRWAHIVASPTTVLTARRDRAVAGEKKIAPPLSALSSLEKARRYAHVASPAPFVSGIVGFVGYEIGSGIEPAAAGPPSPYSLPDMAMASYDASIGFNLEHRRAWIFSRSSNASGRLIDALNRDPRPRLSRSGAPATFQSNFSREDYCAAVEDVRERIRRGDLFQANISQQFTRSGAGMDCLSVFERIAALEPPFGALLQFEEGTLLSASPERFFRTEMTKDSIHIVTEPIKGTRKRGATAQEDAELASALLADPKDRAENIMIVDLLRNDLSRICLDGSVKEEEICALESFATVHHLVSRISGRMTQETTVSDVLEALFPCGSVTGAPKVEAMKTIAEIEKIGRGPYCGAIGYIDDRGNADFSVAIRLMIVDRKAKPQRVAMPVGGGVTWRSNPLSEYEETLVKAQALISASGDAIEAAA